MMRFARIAAPMVTAALCLLVVACSGPVQQKAVTAESLLFEGKFAAARQKAESAGASTPMDRAIIALSYLLETPDRESGIRAVEVLSRQSSEVAAEVAATSMLDISLRMPASPRADLNLLLAEVALGAAGYGAMSTTSRSGSATSESGRILAVSVLDHLALWVRLSEHVPDSQRLLDVWNGAYTLLDGSFDVGDDLLAWRLYTSVGSLGVMMDEVAAGSDLSKVLLNSAVSVVELNPSITVAVRCDLGSPFDDLRVAITRDRKLLGRLERAVSPAAGCSRGTYAPTREK